MSFPAGASVEDSCELDAVFGFRKKAWAGYLDRVNIIGRNEHASAALREMPQSNGEVLRQANAAVRSRMAGQDPGMERDPCPGDPLHVRHGGSAVDIGAMPEFLANDAEYAHGRGVALHSR
jgi:hypothetical protein